MMVARTRFTARQAQARDIRHDIIRAKIGKVKIALKQLQMADDSYRDLLERITGNRTLTLCVEGEIDAVIRELERLGFKATTPKTTRKLDDSEEGRKIRAIWLQLHVIGEVKNSSELALLKYVQRVGKVSAIQWLSAAKCEVVIESLKKWAVRVLPNKMAEQWKQLAAQGKRQAYTPSALDAFIRSKMGPKAYEPYTYDNLLSCWAQLHSELQKDARHA
ncbi:MAG: hypothetical protein CGU29_13460 [Candidatus Dactylopiibacterium carminicum]|uniref:Regulatory protein GemA n=1 Tax=Candidatus Dactylopiibacterium carminicum TaxID=857335 RepID=A0A272EPH6_9RHOO|nr:regulatory protein GemA [Candidatus Dactylopiibacterium carminicum]KAF7598298.1 regulatory protein GemA [Candidatus Dactylopiibacterium carminicum]PAS92034.1 MAG: hypothetical protein CGU29_13460 [Candidatus Dactylopiibacterium carminicum]